MNQTDWLIVSITAAMVVYGGYRLFMYRRALRRFQTAADQYFLHRQSF
jgi:hypothetical protein